MTLKDHTFIIKISEAAPPPSSWTTTYTYTYDANRLADVNGVAYTWDDNGNLLSDGVKTYTYDHANRLVSVAGPSSSVSYAYNGLGDRLQQTVDSVTTNYSLDLNNWLTQVLADGTNTYLYGTARIAQYDASGAEFFLADALGSVRQLADSAGWVQLSNVYEPFGEVLDDAGSIATSYGFTGEWTDSYIELVYLRSRYYSPGIGRFLTKDVWPGDSTRPLSLNGWNYAEGNPVNFADPSGRCVTCIDQDHRNLTYWLINAMKENSQSPEVIKLHQLNSIGNLNVAAIITDWLRRRIEGDIDVIGCDLFSLLWDSETNLPRDPFKSQAYSQWVDLVRKGARWDFKGRIYDELGESIRLCGGECSWFNYDVVANIHFGYVGRAAGFTSLELHLGAGWVQSQDSPGTGKWYTLGDEPGDYWAVDMGIYIYKFVKPERLDAFWFKIGLDTYKGYLKPGVRPSSPYYNYSFGIDPELGPKFPIDYFNGGP